MQQRRAVRYNVSGVQCVGGQRMNVRSNVTLPDAEAGMEWTDEREPFRCTEAVRIPKRRSFQMPVHLAALILCALFVLFGIAAVNKLARKAQITKDITAMRENIALTIQENARLTLEVAAARDSAHISYMAVQTLGMVDSNSVEAVPVIAPDTRPDLAAQTAQAGVWDGMISGSR